MECIKTRLRTRGMRWSRLGVFFFLLHFAAYADQIIYTDSLQNGWQDWSWATNNLMNTNPVHGGKDSISVTAANSASDWEAFYLEIAATNSAGFTNFTFWINGGTGGQQVEVFGLINGNSQTGVQIGPLPTNQWKQINCSMTALGVANQNGFSGFWLQAQGNSPVPTFYLDDIKLQTGPAPPPTTNSVVTVEVDPLASQHAISPMIYGVAFASSNDLAILNFTMNRSGGNSETRYNWQLNAHNLANDWYFESYPDDSAVPGATADAFVANSHAGGAQAMITIPMIGWAPKLGAGRAIIPSYSVAKYGAQSSTDPYLANAGNGVSAATGLAITNNDPNDANFPTNTAFEQTFVQHLIGQWHASTNGGVRYYIMDNEHSLWSSTHQDVHPIGPTMQEIWSKMLAASSMVKSNDPGALVAGPEEWGWPGYLYSGYDQQWSGQRGDYNQADYPDRAANGGWDYMPWLLRQFSQHNASTGQRLLDYFTLHCYPQENSSSGNGVGGNAVDNATELLRNQSTRQFWDTNYVDPSWIDSVIALIPRMKSWVATNYPGTKIGITEYNWGAESYMNGATAQADILGIFGQQGLDLATRWTVPVSNTPTYLAMKIYRNYDGNKSVFGDTSVSATTPNPDNLSAFAAIRTNDSVLTVMVVNKSLSGFTPLQLSVTNFASSGVAQGWQLGSSNAITQLAAIPYAGGVLSNNLPAQSITLFLLPAAKNLRLIIGSNAPPHQLELWMNGQGGQSYILQSSTNLTAWWPVSTNILSTNSFRLLLGVTNTSKIFYRARLNLP